MGRFTYGISNKHRSEQKLPCMQGRSDSGLVLGEYKFKEALHRSSFFFRSLLFWSSPSWGLSGKERRSVTRESTSCCAPRNVFILGLRRKEAVFLLQQRLRGAFYYANPGLYWKEFSFYVNYLFVRLSQSIILTSHMAWINFIGFKVLTSLGMKISVFWYVAPCSP